MNERIRMGERVVTVLRKGDMFSRTPEDVDKMRIVGTVCTCLEDVDSGHKVLRKTHNLVTDAGNRFYAQRVVASGYTDNFTGLDVASNCPVFSGFIELFQDDSGAPMYANNWSDLGTFITGSSKSPDAGYPMLNDADGDNTGAGVDVLTYRVSYTTAEANGSSIDDVVITTAGGGAGTDPLLMHADGLGAFTKSASDTLKVFINHTMSGI